MGALLGDNVVSAIALNIRAAFSQTEMKAVYKNMPKQNIVKPYSFIHQINATHQNEMRNRANWDFLLDIRVHPEDDRTDVQTWARSVSLKLLECLNKITISDQTVKARSVEYKVEDNVLHFIVGYAYKVIHSSESSVGMADMTYGESIKD